MGPAPSRRSLLMGGMALLAGLAAPAGCSTDRPRLRIACGEPGGTYVQVGKLLADAMVTRKLATEVVVVATEGSVANVELLRTGGADLALSLIDTAASSGAVALGRVYQNYLQCLVLNDGPIASVAHLRGRTVSVGAPASGTVHTARLVLDALHARDLTRVELPLSQAVTALSTGEVDALLWSGGIPVPEAERLGHQQLRLLDLTAALTGLEQTYPGLYKRTFVPPGTYAGELPTPAIGIANLLLCRPSLSGDIASGVVDILMADADRLVPGVSVGIQYLTPANLIDTAPVELHPAAVAQYSAAHG